MVPKLIFLHCFFNICYINLFQFVVFLYKFISIHSFLICVTWTYIHCFSYVVPKLIFLHFNMCYINLFLFVVFIYVVPKSKSIHCFSYIVPKLIFLHCFFNMCYINLFLFVFFYMWYLKGFFMYGNFSLFIFFFYKWCLNLFTFV